MTADTLNARIDALISGMTVEEKIAQLQDRAPAIPRLGIPAYNWWNEGLHGIARNGYATVFPQAIGLAATADPGLMQQVGEAVSTEARARFNPHQSSDSARYAGVTIWSPNINIFRDPRWGRGQETYGEDPFLTATLASAFIRGLQGKSDQFYLRAIATPKHFAVHSGPESVRDGFNADVSIHDLNDTYLPAFRRATGESQAAAVMCSYNAINGMPACANSPLLDQRMRGQWGFKGYVVSDCDAVGEITDSLHYTQDSEHGVAVALNSGVDLDCGSTYRHLQGALQQKLIDEQQINRALHRLLLARMRLGMLQDASCSPYSAIPATAIDTPAHRALALRAAEESIVLLRNDRTAGGRPLLPIDVRGRSVAVIGPSADLLSVIEANYHGTAYRAESLFEGLRRVWPRKAQLLYAQGANLAEGATVPVPRTAFAGGGLKAEYFRNADLRGEPALVRKDARIDFDFDHVSPVAQQDEPWVESAGEPYSVRWTGKLTPPAAGSYRLRVVVDRCFDCKGHDAYRLWIDNQLVLDQDGAWKPSGSAPARDCVSFEWKDAAPHEVRLELRHTGEDQGIHLTWEPPAQALRDQALATARKADVILALVGISPDLEGEALSIKIPGFTGGDRDDLGLPRTQVELLKALAALHKPMIVGITSGSPVATSEFTADIKEPLALLQLWYPGQGGGAALAHLLNGDLSPSGRLPVTIYRSASALPAFTDYSMARRTYRYLGAETPVEYRFGYGLSYSRFTYTPARPDRGQLQSGELLHVTTVVRNQGSRDADEVAELYVMPPKIDGAPQLMLQGVQRLHLRVGESRSVTFELSARQLSTVDEDGRRAVRPGTYRVYIGGAQPDHPTTDGTPFLIVGETVGMGE
jgi:beta-glucosidase